MKGSTVVFDAKTASALLLAATLCGLVACSSDPDDDSADAGDTDADTDTDADAGPDGGADAFPWDWECTIAAEIPCDAIAGAPSEYQIHADGFAEDGLTLVHASLSPTVILAERVADDQPIPVVVLVTDVFPTETVEISLAEAPPEPLRAVDVFSPYQQEYSAEAGFSRPDEAIGHPVVLLLCGDSSCGLYAVTVDGGGIAEGIAAIPGGEVPLAQASAITGVYEEEAVDRVCVAGDGVACFDGYSWSDELPAGGGALRAIASGRGPSEAPFLLTAGDGGRIATDRSGAWEEIETGSVADFVTADVNGEFFAAGGDGAIVIGDFGHHILCEPSGMEIAVVFANSAYYDFSTEPAVSALAADGSVYEIAMAEDRSGFTTCTHATPLDGTPTDAYFWPIGADAIFSYAITDTALFQRVEVATGP